MKQAKPLGFGSLMGLAAFGIGAAVWLYTFVLLIVPSEIADIVNGDDVGHESMHAKGRPQGTSLGITLLVGALVSVTVSPFLGSISDSCRAGSCGRRVPFILGGVLAAALAGIGLYLARTFWSYTLWFAAVQACIAMAMTAFNGLLYERVPASQRGLASGVMGGSIAAGNMLGAVLGLVYTSVGRFGTFIVVYALVVACAGVTAVFSGDVDSAIARIPLVGALLLRFRGKIALQLQAGRGGSGTGSSYTALRRRSNSGDASAGSNQGVLSMAELNAELGYGGASPDDTEAEDLELGAQLSLADDEAGDAFADADGDLTWDKEDAEADLAMRATESDTPAAPVLDGAGGSSDEHAVLGASAISEGTLDAFVTGAHARAGLDDTLDDASGALPAVISHPRGAAQRTARQGSQEHTPGVASKDDTKLTAGIWTRFMPLWLRAACLAAAEFLAPFGDHDFRWAFISRLLYQQAIYTVQTYLLYYIRDAVPLPAGLQPHVALSMVMLPLLCCALLSPVLAGWVSDASGGAKRRLLVGAGLLMVLVTVGMATIRSWQVLPWLGALFGAGYGTFNALDFALAMDVLPGGDSHAAKDLGLWNLALALPMCLAAPVAGILLDRFNGPHHEGYTVLFAAATVYLLLGVLCVLKVRALK